MTLSDLAIKRPVFAWMLMLFLILFGIIGFLELGISKLPDVDFPVVAITAIYPGAAPEVMERDVIDPLEDAVMGIQDVKNVTSTATNGAATIIIEFEISRNIDLAMQDVQSKISQAQAELPTDLQPIALEKANPQDFPIMWLAVQDQQMATPDLMVYVKDHVQDQITTVPGVANVWAPGYLAPQLRVWVRHDELKKRALTVTDVVNAVRAEDVEPPAGLIDYKTKAYNLRTLGQPVSPEAFGNIIINNRGGGPNFNPVRLADVARVEEGTEDVTHYSDSNGKRAVGLGVVMQRGGNAVDVAQGVRAKVAAIEKHLPKGMKITVNFDSTHFVRQSVDELETTLVLSVLLTALVCWIFLGSWSSTLNVLLAIPTSVLGTFIVIYFMGFTLNIFTLLGLSLAIGIVVDDAIMVLENIIRHRELGQSRHDAAVAGAREITFAALAASFAIVAIFLPIALMHGIIGKFLYQFGITLTAAVLLSLLEALTLTPMRASKFVDPAGRRRTVIGRGFERGFGAVRRGYERSLAFTLRHRTLIIGAALVLFLASLTSVKWLRKEFLPPEDQSALMVRLTLPPGSSLAVTGQALKVAEDYMGKRPEVASTFAAVGGFTGGEENSAMMFVSLVDPKKRKLTQQQLQEMTRDYLKQKIPDARPVVQDPSQRGFTTSRGFPIEFTVQGPDWDTLGKTSQKLMAELRKTGLMTDVDTDYEVGSPEIDVVPDRKAAAAHGVTVTSIADTVGTMMGGTLVGKYPKAGHLYDVRVRLDGVDRLNPFPTINTLEVLNNRGEVIPLKNVVKVEQRPSMTQITRRNRARAVTIFANVAPGKSQQDALDAVRRLSQEVLPKGYVAIFSGSSETYQETFRDLILALVLGLLVAYMVLATQFDSFIDPVTVFMALPFSFTGAFVALLLTNQSLNMYSMIGLVLLMGIVKKNSILLVDFTNQQRDREGRDVHDALLVACPIRLRPILMTSIAIIVGAIPAAASLGPGAESRKPMSIAVIGGVLVSTFLTLFVVPAVYSFFARFDQREKRAATERAHGGPEAPQPAPA